MKNKYLLTILIAITSLFVGLSGVKGVTNDPLDLIKIKYLGSTFGGVEDSSGVTGVGLAESKECSSQICARISGRSGTNEDRSFGIKISIIKADGTVVKGSKVIWGNELNSQSTKNQLKFKLGEKWGAVNYSEWIKNLSDETKDGKEITNYLIKTITEDSSKTWDDYSSYYFKIEPYISFRYAHTDFSSKYDEKLKNASGDPLYVRYKEGTVHEVINWFLNFSKSTSAYQCAQDFVNGGKGGCIAGAWNVFRNIVTDPKTVKNSVGDKLYGYTNVGSLSAKTLVEKYRDSSYDNTDPTGDSGLGIGVVKINNFSGKINIVKVNSSGAKIVSKTTTLKLEKVHKKTGVGSEEIITIKELKSSPYHTSQTLSTEYYYTIKEINAPNGYATDDLPSEDFEIEAGEELEIKITNLTICEKELAKLKNTYAYFTTDNAKLALIDTYYYLKNTHNLNYQGLLNFSNPSCAYITKKVTPTIDCFNFKYQYAYKKYTEYKVSAYTGEYLYDSEDIPNNFNTNDVSLFHGEPLEYTSFTGQKTYLFCQQEYNFTGHKSDNPSVKSGIPLWVTPNESEAIFATAVYRNNCYAYGSSKSQFMLKVVQDNSKELPEVYDPTDVNLFDPRAKVKDVTLNVDSGNQLNISDEAKSNNVSNIYTTGNITTQTTFNYNMPLLYAYYGSGIRYMGPDFTETYLNEHGIKSIGYGIWTKLNAEGQSNMYFTVNYYDDASGGSWKTASPVNACKYTATPEIIIDDKLNLEYRTIDTGNPFPGSNGSGRHKVGANWCDGNNCTLINNKLIAEYITGGTVGAKPNDSYTQSYKYKITLTPDAIKDIRAYNETHSYDDWTIDDDTSNVKEHVRTFFQSLGVTIDVN